ncbi:MAG: hypothetical protein KAJ75_04805 [Alphaproteobacteria bacterium]|nr:hypothetical protein [Alphaproteobacteria bacterium]
MMNGVNNPKSDAELAEAVISQFETVATDDDTKASTSGAVFDAVNAVGGGVVGVSLRTSSGSIAVPAGATKAVFELYGAGGGSSGVGGTATASNGGSSSISGSGISMTAYGGKGTSYSTTLYQHNSDAVGGDINIRGGGAIGGINVGNYSYAALAGGAGGACKKFVDGVSGSYSITLGAGGSGGDGTVGDGDQGGEAHALIIWFK